jgi:hypothetical protein
MVGYLTELGGDSTGEGLAGDLRLPAAVAAGVWRRAREMREGRGKRWRCCRAELGTHDGNGYIPDG